MDFVCGEPRPDFPFSALLPGDILAVRFFVTYELDEAGLIRELCSMAWPADQGVTKAPMLSACAGGRAAYRAYAAAFSPVPTWSGRGAIILDCTLDLPNLPTFAGR